MTDDRFESILRQALHPEVTPEETAVSGRGIRKGNGMNIKRVMGRLGAVAAVLVLLVTTVYATDGLHIKTLISGKESYSVTDFDKMDKAMEKAGFQMDVKEQLAGDYTFENAEVTTTRALDEADQEQFQYPEMSVQYQNASGDQISLIAHARQEGIVTSERDPDQTRIVGEIAVDYRLDHYKFVPPDYERTEEDRLNEQRPDYFISEGSEQVEEKDIACLSWEKDGICYTIMDMGAAESEDTLFDMAQELILMEK